MMSLKDRTMTPRADPLSEPKLVVSRRMGSCIKTLEIATRVKLMMGGSMRTKKTCVSTLHVTIRSKFALMSLMLNLVDAGDEDDEDDEREPSLLLAMGLLPLIQTAETMMSDGSGPSGAPSGGAVSAESA